MERANARRRTFVFPDHRVLFHTLTTLVLIAFGCVRIVKCGAPIVADQGFIGHSLLSGYPSLESGVSSLLIAGLINLYQPTDPVAHNALFRSFALGLYMVCGSLLSWSLSSDERRWPSILFLLLVFSSRFAFLWLSSEVLAGAFLMLTLWSVVRRHPFHVTSICLALFSFSKPNLILSGLVVGVFLALYEGKSEGSHPSTHLSLHLRLANGVDRQLRLLEVGAPRIKRLLIVVGILSLPVLAGIMRNGFSYVKLGQRSWVSFGQHYADLVQHHQLTPPPDPWGKWQAYTDTVLGQANSVQDVVRIYSWKYLDFVFLSLSRAISILWVQMRWVVLLAALGLHKLQERKLKIITLLFLVDLLPIVMLSHLHVRYLARYYPLALFGMFASLKYAREAWVRFILIAGAVLLVVYQVPGFPFILSGQWFPD